MSVTLAPLSRSARWRPPHPPPSRRPAQARSDSSKHLRPRRTAGHLNARPGGGAATRLPAPRGRPPAPAASITPCIRDDRARTPRDGPPASLPVRQKHRTGSTLPIGVAYLLGAHRPFNFSNECCTTPRTALGTGFKAVVRGKNE